VKPCRIQLLGLEIHLGAIGPLTDAGLRLPERVAHLQVQQFAATGEEEVLIEAEDFLFTTKCVLPVLDTRTCLPVGFARKDTWADRQEGLSAPDPVPARAVESKEKVLQCAENVICRNAGRQAHLVPKALNEFFVVSTMDLMTSLQLRCPQEREEL
jgi:hypothetical protein